MTKRMHFRGTLLVDPTRGTVYFHDEKGGCILRIEGLPTPIKDPADTQIDVRLTTAIPDQSEYFDWAMKAEGSIKAVIVRTWAEHRTESRRDRKEARRKRK